MKFISISRRKFLAASAKVGVTMGLASQMPFGVRAATAPIDLAIAKGEPVQIVKLAVTL